MNTEPVTLNENQAEAAGGVLARAFQEYPLMVWFYPDPEERQRIQTRVFTRMVRYALRYGEVRAVSPELEGVLVWLPSEKSRNTWWRDMLSGNYGLPFGLGKKQNPRQAAYHTYAVEAHQRAISVPHLYIRLLGVDPAYQGKSYASLLLQSAFEQADREGRPCWLETQMEKNVAIYRHIGFEVVEEGTIPGGEVKSWGMLRMPPP